MSPRGVTLAREPGAAPDEPPEERLLGVADVVRLLRRQWLLIVGGGLAAAAITALVVLFLSPPRYQASATLVVVPLTFKSQLKPPVLPIQGYQRLLESDAVIGETLRRLQEKGVLADGEGLRLGRDLASRIFVSRRAEENILAPVVEAVGYGSTAEKAATIANTWADVFLERTRLLLNNSVSPTLELIEDQYEKERARLESLERERVEATTQYDQRIEEVAATWEKRLVDAGKETQDLIASYNIETRLEMQELAARNGLGAGAPGGLGAAAGDGSLGKKLLQILSLRAQLAQTPRVVTLEKAISDDTLWQLMTLTALEETEIQPVLSQRLLTEEVNPVYEGLALELSRIEIDLSALSPAESQLVQAFSASLEKLAGERSAGLNKLAAERTMVIDRLERQKTLAIESLRREKMAFLGRLKRDIQNQTMLHSKLAQNYNEVTLARAETGAQDVRLGAPAVAPMRPERKLLLKAAVAAVVGALFGLLAAVVREWGGSSAVAHPPG